ncbi:MAG: hypothetical protein KAT43_05950 [Nanoarchaeota archaeon]|nr:hypothetical protein [Nanoarchaeota archaeon]
MDLEKIKKLPLEEQTKALKELKQEFEEERQKLKDEILRFEGSKKTKESFAKSLADERRVTTAAEISLIVSSIKDVKESLAAKNKELEFLQRAITSAEKLLEKSKKELEAEEEQRELSKIRRFIDELIIRQQQTEAEKPRVSARLEEEVKKTKTDDEDTLEEGVEDVRTRNELEKNVRETEENAVKTADYSKDDTKTYMSESPSEDYEARNPVREEEEARQRQYVRRGDEEEDEEETAGEEHFGSMIKYKKKHEENY